MSSQCAAAAAMIEGATASLVSLTTECSTTPPKLKRRVEQVARAPVTISGKADTKRNTRINKAQMRKLFAMLSGHGDDGAGGDLGGNGGKGSGGGGRGEDPWGSDGSGDDRDDWDENADSASLQLGKYIDTTWMWHLCCLFCLANTSFHIRQRNGAVQAYS